MNSSHSLLLDFSQHASLPVRLIAPGFGHLPSEAAAHYGATHRLAYYFFLFVWEGTAECGIDLEKYTIGPHELVFSLPHQIRQLPAARPGHAYYKLGFHDDCLSRLPRQYSFLLDPFNRQKIAFTAPAAARLRAVFELLKDLLRTPDTNPDLLLAHLNSLLSEMEAAYFAATEKPADGRLAKYSGFKTLVENTLTEHPTIGGIADELALSTDSLYQLVKHYSGLSPKEFITNRLMLEARRRLYYGEQRSTKELAFELGFNDPAYFARLFKKVTGKTVAAFCQDLS